LNWYFGELQSMPAQREQMRYQTSQILVGSQLASDESSWNEGPASAGEGETEWNDAHASTGVSLRDAIERHKEDVLACVGADRVAVVAESKEGKMHVGLHGNLANSAEEECVQHVLKDLKPSAKDERVIHVVKKQ
jgi:hypothetical protein